MFDDLVQQFDESTVFMDVSAIEAGRDFRKAIEEGVTKCGVLLVVMGPEWLEAKDEHGKRRLDDPGDFVRIETASALKRDIPVIPVLVRGAKMPTAEQLPDDLKELAFRNCVELTHARWRSDILLLIEALRRLEGISGPAATLARSRLATAISSPEVVPTASAELREVTVANSAAIDPAVIERVSRELAHYIGPIAGLVVKRAASNCASLEDLYRRVAQEIDSPAERQKFLQLANISSSSLLIPQTATQITTPATDTSQTFGAQAAEGSDPRFRKAAAGREKPSSGGGKYLLLAGAFAVVVLVGVVYFASTRRSSHYTEAPGAEMPIREPVPAKTRPGAPEGEAPVRNKIETPQRVRVSAEVSQGLLITKVVPAYPPLARQAHIQGMVVFNAQISRDGEVEHLSLANGHPMLVPSALEAVKQWRYKPYVLNGERVAMDTQITVNFTLKGG